MSGPDETSLLSASSAVPDILQVPPSMGVVRHKQISKQIVNLYPLNKKYGKNYRRLSLTLILDFFGKNVLAPGRNVIGESIRWDEENY